MKALFAVALLMVAAAGAGAQDAAAAARLRPTVDSLFAAMRRGDTTAVRSAFVPTARVIPFPASSAQPIGPGLTVDAFVSFAGRNAPGSWDETIVSTTGATDGTLGAMWFSYRIARTGGQPQCGTNSVQLVETQAGWKIVSMVFTGRQTGC